MSIIYPANIDNLITLPEFSNKVSISNLNELRKAVINIETELGVKPSSIYSNVRGRLDLLESTLNSIVELGTPDATASTKGVLKLTEDLSGTSALPQVVGLHGRSLSISGQQDGYALIYNSLTDSYKFGAVTSPDATSSIKGVVTLTNNLAGTASSPQVVGLYGKSLSIVGQQDGYALVYNLLTDSYKFTAVVSPDATSSVKGIVTLTNDFGGTASLPQVIGILGKQIDSSIQQDGYCLSYNLAGNNYKFIKNNPSLFADLQLTSSLSTVLGLSAGSYYSLGQATLDTSSYKSYNTYSIDGVYYVINNASTNTLTLSLYNLTIGAEVINASFTNTSPTTFSVNFTPTAGINIYEIRGKLNIASPSGSDGFSVSNIKIRIL